MIARIDLLRAARGSGVVTLDPAIERELVALWNEGLVRRDDVKPYTYTTQPGVLPEETDDADE